MGEPARELDPEDYGSSWWDRPGRVKGRGTDGPQLETIEGGDNSSPAEDAAAEARRAEWGVIEGGSGAQKEAAEDSNEEAGRKEQQSYYTGAGGGQQKNGKQKAKGAFKKFGPTGGIVGAIIAMMVGGSFGMLSLLPIHTGELLKSMMDSQYSGFSMRNSKLFFHSVNRSVTSTGIRGKAKYEGLGGRQIARLEAEGITPMCGGSKCSEVGGIFRKTPDEFRVFETRVYADGSSRVDYVDFTADDFNTRINEPSGQNLRNGTQKALQSRWNAWWDESTARFLSQFDITRNIFRKFIDDVEAIKAGNQANPQQARAEIDEAFNNSMSGEGRLGEIDIGSVREVSDDNNSGGKKLEPDTNGSSRSDVRDFADNISSKVGIAKLVSQGGCGILQLSNVLNILASSMASGSMVGFASGFLNFSDMTKVGDATPELGDQWNNKLTTKGSDGRTMIESPGMMNAYTGSWIDMSDPVAQKYSLNSIGITFGAFISNNPGSFTGCNVAKSVVATVSVVAGVLSFGVGKFMMDLGIGLATAALTAAVMPLITDVALPLIAEIAVGDFANGDTEGADAGEATRNGSVGTGNSACQRGGCPAVGKTQAVNGYRVTKEILARDAEIERQTKSPFDATSPNTFFGSIVTKIIPYMGNMSSVSNVVMSIGSIAKRSAFSLLPTASAIDDEEYLQYISVCQDQGYKDIGIVADPYCNPIMSYDHEAIETVSPSELVDFLDSGNNIEYKTAAAGETVEEVVPGSGLSRYIDYCTGRESRWGVYDSNIINSMSHDPGAVVNAIPVVGEIVDVFTSIENQANADWATGQNCVNTDNNRELWNTEMKYYQQYMLDNRILESMGNIEENPVVAYMDKRELENPKDNSFEGYIARVTGQDMEMARQVAGLIRDYLAAPDQTYIASLGPVREVREMKLVREQKKDAGLGLIGKVAESVRVTVAQILAVRLPKVMFGII